MKLLFKFLRTTFTGGILFLLPLVLIGLVFQKIHLILVKISAPLAAKLPNGFFGLDMEQLLSVLIILIICFLSGLLFRAKAVRKSVKALESNLLSYIPGYSLVKAVVSDAV